MRCWCITILIDFYILVLPSCMSSLKRPMIIGKRPSNEVGSRPPKQLSKFPAGILTSRKKSSITWKVTSLDLFKRDVQTFSKSEIQDGFCLCILSSFPGLRNSSRQKSCVSAFVRRLVCFLLWTVGTTRGMLGLFRSG